MPVQHMMLQKVSIASCDNDHSQSVRCRLPPNCTITEALALVQHYALRSRCKLPLSRVPAWQRMTLCSCKFTVCSAGCCCGMPPCLYRAATPRILIALQAASQQDACTTSSTICPLRRCAV